MFVEAHTTNVPFLPHFTQTQPPVLLLGELCVTGSGDDVVGVRVLFACRGRVPRLRLHPLYSGTPVRRTQV